MVKVRWKFERGEVYLEVEHPNNFNVLYYYWFPKIGNKKFHPRQIFTRRINWETHKNNLIPHITSSEGWIEGELGDHVLDKLGIIIYTSIEFCEQLSKAC